MLRSNPMYFNTTEIPFPSSFTESYDTIESVNQSEAGTDLVNVTRYGKLTATMTIKCLPDVLADITAFATEDSFTFRRWNPITGAYENRTVRMRNLQVALVSGSQDLSEVDGVWSISFSLEEF